MCSRIEAILYSQLLPTETKSTYTVLEPTRFFFTHSFAIFASRSSFHCHLTLNLSLTLLLSIAVPLWHEMCCFMQYRWIYFEACALYRYRVSQFFFFVLLLALVLLPLLLLLSLLLPSISERNKCAHTACVCVCMLGGRIILHETYERAIPTVLLQRKRQQAHIITCYQWRCVYHKNGKSVWHAIVFYGVYDVPTEYNHTVYISLALLYELYAHRVERLFGNCKQQGECDPGLQLFTCSSLCASFSDFCILLSSICLILRLSVSQFSYFEMSIYLQTLLYHCLFEIFLALLQIQRAYFCVKFNMNASRNNLK